MIVYTQYYKKNCNQYLQKIQDIQNELLKLKLQLSQGGLSQAQQMQIQNQIAQYNTQVQGLVYTYNNCISKAPTARERGKRIILMADGSIKYVK